MKPTTYVMNKASPRLSDEEPDPLERDDPDDDPLHESGDRGLPWDSDDLLDIRNIVDELPVEQQEIVEAMLLGQNHEDLEVTEKYWRYHLAKAVATIRRKMGINLI
jgi:hypothetical protein